MGQNNVTLANLPEPGEPVFYPKVGHCIYRGVTQDASAPDVQLLELEDIEKESRILIPLPRVPSLNLRAAGAAFDEIKEILSSEFEEPLEDENDRHLLLEKLIAEGSPTSLAKALKRLHLLHQSSGLSREDEQSRKKIRSWLAAELSLSRELTRAEAQAFMTRVLRDAIAAYRHKEKEKAKERRRIAKEQKAAEEVVTAETITETLRASNQSPAIESSEVRQDDIKELTNSADTLKPEPVKKPEQTEPLEQEAPTAIAPTSDKSPSLNE